MANALGRAYLDLLGPLLEVPDVAVADAMDLLVEHPRLGAFDAVLASAAIRRRCTALVSTDEALAEIRGCQVVVPDDDGIDRLLGRQRSVLRRQAEGRPQETVSGRRRSQHGSAS